MITRLALSFVILCVGASAEEIRPGVYRTPDERFADLPDYNYAPNYVDVNGYRMHYVDAGPKDGQVVLLLHGEPTWSYLYRHMIPGLVAAGHRCIAPDLIGFGKSDKPASMDTHTYAFHVENIKQLIEKTDLKDITLFCQDWGGLIGLRVAAENPERFARIVAANTGLPTGEGGPSPAFENWKKMNQAMIDAGDMPVGMLVAGAAEDPAIAKAYDAPFPTPEYKAGALILPQRVPMYPDDPAREANEKAWEVFRAWEKPFLTAFSDGDPITRGGDKLFQTAIPGAQGQAHTTVKGGGHFLQESNGPELATIINKFITANP